MRLRNEEDLNWLRHKGPLMTALRSIAKNRKLDNPDLAIKILLRKLVSRIKHHRYEIFRNLHYDLLIEPRMAQAAASPPWICYLVRWTTNMQSVGRLRGSQPSDLTTCIREAASITTKDQLTPVERRAVDLIMGGRPKARKSVIEQRAIRLEIFDELAGGRIEPRDAVVEHRAGPHFAVLVDRHVTQNCSGGVVCEAEAEEGPPEWGK
jgi:hypothetical protein